MNAFDDVRVSLPPVKRLWRKKDIFKTVWQNDALNECEEEVNQHPERDPAEVVDARILYLLRIAHKGGDSEGASIFYIMADVLEQVKENMIMGWIMVND